MDCIKNELSIASICRNHPILKENDEVNLRIFKFDISQPSKLMFHGYDPNIRLKKNYTPELVRDEKSNYEEIIVD